jgi:hypothetical protein
MSTPHTIALPAPRIRIRQAPLLTALGLLAAITATIVILALNGANHTTATVPAPAVHATSGSVPRVRYLGPRQQQAAQISQTQASGTTAPQYICLGPAQARCLR